MAAYLSINSSQSEHPDQSIDKLEEPFFMHAREESSVNCCQMAHGLFISLLMISLTFSGQFLPYPPTVKMPFIFQKTYLQGSEPGDQFVGSLPGDYFEPLYMFWVGFNIQVSVKKQYRRTLTLWGNIAVRGFFILLTGVMINLILSDFSWSQFRIMGFFQKVLLLRILMLLLHLFTAKKIQYFIVGLFFLCYLGIITTVGGSSDCEKMSVDVELPQCNGICFLDQQLLTSRHMQFKYFDSDGLFSTPNVLFISYLGYQFAIQLTHLAVKNLKRMLLLWLIGSVVLVLIGILTNIIWTFIPVIYLTNFTIFAAGIAGIIMIFLFLAFDLLNKKYALVFKIFSPLKWIGKHGLLLFGFRCLLESIFIQTNVTSNIVNSIGFFQNSDMNGLLYNLLFYIFIVLIAYCLEKVNVTIRF